MLLRLRLQGLVFFRVKCFQSCFLFVRKVAVVDMFTIRHDAGSCFKQAEE